MCKMKKVIVRLENFSKSFGKKEVIKDINLDIYENEFITFLGSSGCGKTTILRSISGLDNPTSGKVYIDDVDVTNLEAPKRQVNTIFQNYALFPLMTVYDNIAFGLKMKKVDKKQIDKRVQEMLELVHLEGYEKRFPRELSGGEQQRVSLARGLINKPKVLLLDEPLSALDLKLRKEMQIELKRLQRKLKITFIYVTHDQDEALSMSDRIAIIKNGKIEQIGSPNELYDTPNTLYVASFIGDANIFDAKVEKIAEKKNLVYLNDNVVGYINDKEYKVKDKVKVVIRPENIKIADRRKKENGAVGIVEEFIYDGSNTRLIVNVDNRLIKVLVFGNDVKYELEQKLYLYWDIEDVIIFGDNNEE